MTTKIDLPESVIMAEIHKQVNRRMVPQTLGLLLAAFDGDVDAMRAAVEDFCAKQKARRVGGAR
jgi:hypothetical protein